jgi:hypothetical protein
MNRLLVGLVVLAMSVAALSCGDPTGSLRGGATKVVTDPSLLFLTEGQTKSFEVRVLDEQGNELADSVTLETFPSAVVDVKVDSAFLLGTDTTQPGPIPSKTRTKFNVTAMARDSGTIVVGSGGLTASVPVRVLPGTAAFDAAFSTLTPGLTEEITITAPAGFSFAPNATIAFGGDTTAVFITNRAPDGSSIQFLIRPNSSGPAALTGIVPAYDTALKLPFTTTEEVTAVAFDSLDVALPASVPQNQPITVDLSATGFHFDTNATVAFGGTAALILNRSADSTVVSVLPQPGSLGPGSLDRIFPAVLPQFRLNLPTKQSTVVAPLSAIPGDDDPSTAPAVSTPSGPGDHTAFFDAGTFTGADITGDGGFGAQYYKLTVATAGDVTITTDWDNDADMDQVLCFDVGCVGEDFTAATAAQPESATYTLTAGTYYLAIVFFDVDPRSGKPPTKLTVTMSEK